ncbi:hypothetical protein BDV93DRAFT_548603 [Ceratobasidium sp. AG-I]|nr:hypothetical protein BDV93DRAFT_548603 [Ceratobasidium sp. AG-I]
MIFTALPICVTAVFLAQAVSAGLLTFRQGGPSDDDLLLSCPGAPGSPNIERADRCVLKDPVRQPDIRYWVVLGAAQGNCGGGTDPIEWTVGGSKTITRTVNVGLTSGINVDGISIGGSVQISDSIAVTVSESVKVTIPPGRQAVHAAGINHQVFSSNVKINYPDRVFGHYEWYTSAIATVAYPMGDNIIYDPHFSDCGTDPYNLNQ